TLIPQYPINTHSTIPNKHSSHNTQINTHSTIPNRHLSPRYSIGTYPNDMLMSDHGRFRTCDVILSPLTMSKTGT
ncbi:hypothetical protein VIGAN_06177300, partial [Vigna angularis var. angularis]